MNTAPPPPLDYNGDGWAETGRFRLRPTWFFGLAVAEELYQCSDGRSEWRRIITPREIKL